MGQSLSWWSPCRIQVVPSVQRRSLADAHYAAKTRKPLKLAGVPQTTGPISAANGLMFTILWGHLEDILLLNMFFFQLSIRALVAKIYPNKLCDSAQVVIFLRLFLSPAFPGSRMQQVSDLHLKFALRPHHPICNGWDCDGKKKKEEETTGQKYNGLPYCTLSCLVHCTCVVVQHLCSFCKMFCES